MNNFVLKFVYIIIRILVNLMETIVKSDNIYSFLFFREKSVVLDS